MLLPSNCKKRNCIHYGGVRWLGESEATEVYYCAAFPKGIPDDISSGDIKHVKPIDGDNGIQFEEA